MRRRGSPPVANSAKERTDLAKKIFQHEASSVGVNIAAFSDALRLARNERCLDTLSLWFIVHSHVLPATLRFVAAYVALGHGVVEGKVNKLKLMKRMGYGRAGFALLRQRVLHAL